MRLPILILAGVLTVCAPARARDPLGVFETWGAFRDDKPRKCFAIAEPDARRPGGGWRPFFSVASWPERHIQGQIHIRLRKYRMPQSPVILAIQAERFRLVAGRADAWAPDARTDAAIIRAMRNGGWLSVIARSETGGAFSDAYPLRGAATAIDAALIACARRR